MRGDKRAGPLRQAQGHAREDVVLDGDAVSVRQGLARLFNLPILSRLTEESRGAAQIVLAEVLNNIVEHAYASHPGQIELTVTSHDTFLFVRTVDRGLAMPGGDLPGGKLAAGGKIKDLPEGGFGWFLIRSLTQELSYVRQEGANILSFCMDVEYHR